MHTNAGTRRRYDDELKGQVLAACEEAGASVAGVALRYGLNANLVHKWRRGRGVHAVAVPSLAGPTPVQTRATPSAPSAEFVALSLPAAAAPPQAVPKPGDIRVEHKRGTTTVLLSWPLEGAGECAAWLRELLL